MALSAAFVEQHISNWEKALRTPYRPYREKWPSRLFHHAPIENAVLILKDGNLRSRHDRGNARTRDVAAAGVIDSRVHAHDFARLYFRPRTPTQWHIEGIRKPGECAYGEDAHAPILIMMIFDARKVLTRSGVHFCDRNMQLGAAEPSDTEAYFNTIPFDKVFHEGGTGGDRSIIEHRCAEVLATSPLPLDETLQWIYCRTEAEKTTLLHLLGPAGQKWTKNIVISDDLLVFERKYVFVDDVSIDSKGLVVKLSPRQDRQRVDVQITVLNSEGNTAISFRNNSMDAVPAPPSDRWRIAGALANGTYLVEIRLEGHMAFNGKLSIGQNIFL